MTEAECGQLHNPNVHGVETLCRADVRPNVNFVWYLPQSDEPPIRGTFLSDPEYTEDGWMVEARTEGSDHNSEYCLRDMGITSDGDGSWSPYVTIADTE